MKIKGAIFDMDGTIVDSLSFWGVFWKCFGVKFMSDPNFVPAEEADKSVRTMIYSDVIPYIYNFYKLPVSFDEFKKFAEENDIVEFYKNVATPKQGARELLQFLKDNGVRICLASATEMRGIRFALQHYDLAKYFDFVLSCADIGVGKDKPDIYLDSMNLLRLPQSEICVFEDSYVALETAKRVGFKTVGIYDKFNFEQDRLKNASDFYLDQTQSLDRLIDVIEV